MRRLICLIIAICFASALSAQDSTAAEEGYQRALELIEEAKISNQYCLYLNYMSLETVPPEIAELSDLKCLDLSGNQLTEVPAVLFEMSNLNYVSLYNNPLNIPSELHNKDWATIKAYFENPVAWQFNQYIKYAVGFSGLVLVYVLAYIVSGKSAKTRAAGKYKMMDAK